MPSDGPFWDGDMLRVLHGCSSVIRDVSCGEASVRTILLGLFVTVCPENIKCDLQIQNEDSSIHVLVLVEWSIEV